MALSLKPELIIMDEPTTALDVVVQREILQQVEALKRDFGFAVLFITHDLSLLLEFADRIAIMYAGEIVETAPAAELGERPRHPYTQGLWSRSRRSRPARAPDGNPGLAARPARPAERVSLPSPAARTACPTRATFTAGRRPSGRRCVRSSPGTSSPATSSRRRAMSAAPLEVRS